MSRQKLFLSDHLWSQSREDDNLLKCLLGQFLSCDVFKGHRCSTAADTGETTLTTAQDFTHSLTAK